MENNTDFVRRSYHQPTTYAQNLLVRRNLEHQGFPITRVTNPDGTWTAAAVYTGYANMAEGNSYRDNLKFDMKNTTVVTIDLIKDVLVAKADYSYLFNHSRQNDVISQVTYSNGPGIQISYPAKQLDAHHRDADRIPQRQRQPLVHPAAARRPLAERHGRMEHRTQAGAQHPHGPRRIHRRRPNPTTR